MAERILSEETINTFREYLVLEEKTRPPWRNISVMSVLFICLHANRL